jgi:hypothetical protein
MKYIMCSRTFPAGHPKAGQFTYFPEKILNCFRENFQLPDSFKSWIDNYAALLKGEDYLKAVAVRDLKHHTIRSGSRFKPGETVSLRVWSGRPYCSKQIEFAQVEVKKVWDFCISDGNFSINTIQVGSFHPFCTELAVIAKNDGLDIIDFINWFAIHPKKKEHVFRGQIISWSNKVNY